MCAGWFRAKPDAGFGRVDPGMINDKSTVCVQNFAGAKYLPANLNAHVVAHAICVSGPAAGVDGSPMNPNDASGSPGATPTTPPVTPSPPDTRSPPTSGGPTTPTDPAPPNDPAAPGPEPPTSPTGAVVSCASCDVNSCLAAHNDNVCSIHKPSSHATHRHSKAWQFFRCWSTAWACPTAELSQQSIICACARMRKRSPWRQPCQRSGALRFERCPCRSRLVQNDLR
jgi:hypothetical protein